MKKKKSSSKLTGVYAGTFDPVTLGHLDIIERAAKVVDHLVIAVATNPGKNPLFSIEERLKMLKTDVANNPKLKGKSVQVVAFDKLLMHFMKDINAQVVVRGLRAVTDFADEFQLAGMNSKLDKNVETIFFMSQDKFQFISSSYIREISRLHGDISQFVTPNVASELKKKFNKKVARPAKPAAKKGAAKAQKLKR